ncbi:MAG: signal peptidase I [Eubacteriales bacterium]|nr:signal peptidase I [Eubacteriales bacterium]
MMQNINKAIEFQVTQNIGETGDIGDIEHENLLKPEKQNGENKHSGSANTDFLSSVFEWIELFVFSFSLVLVIMTFAVRHSPVIGSSMAHTLEEKDILLVSGIMYEPKQNDIIVFQSPNVGYDEPLVKRIIAVGGQEINIDFSTWTVLVNNEKLDETYVNYEEGRSMLSSNMQFPLTIPEGYVFVMGDNRNHSLDSRNSMVGLVNERYIIGRVIFRVYPFDKIGPVE